jgi:Family of unknown function (DUF6370)
MKSILALLILCLTGSFAYGQAIASKPGAFDSAKKTMIVDASCGMCQFGMKGSDCLLAVRFNGKAYYVDGTGIDEHGDAHAAAGFCNAVRKAKVQGEVVDGRFKADYFKLLAADAGKKGKKKKTPKS